MTDKIAAFSENYARRIKSVVDRFAPETDVRAQKDPRGNLGNFSSPVEITSALIHGKCKMKRLWYADGVYQTRNDDVEYDLYDPVGIGFVDVGQKAYAVWRGRWELVVLDHKILHARNLEPLYCNLDERHDWNKWNEGGTVGTDFPPYPTNFGAEGSIDETREKVRLVYTFFQENAYKNSYPAFFNSGTTFEVYDSGLMTTPDTNADPDSPDSITKPIRIFICRPIVDMVVQSTAKSITGEWVRVSMEGGLLMNVSKTSEVALTEGQTVLFAYPEINLRSPYLIYPLC